MTNDSAVLAKIEHALKSAKPGLPAQLKMMPYPFPDRRSYAEVKGRAFAAEVKGRAFGSPLARGLYRRASTAEMDPRAKPGAPPAVDPRAKPGAPAAVEDVRLKAGVMLLLYPRDDSWHLPLILRTNTVMHHKDQISFPGGQLEPGEEKWTIRGELLNIPFYAYKDHKIWGATAMVLAEFLDILFFPRPNKIK